MTTVKHISKRLTSYIAKHDVYVPQSFRPNDLKALAKEGSFLEGIQLTRLMLITATNCNCPRHADIIRGLPTLSESTKNEIAAMIRESQPPSSPEPSGSEPDNASSDGVLDQASTEDPELLHEEQMGRVTAENNRLLLENQDLLKECRDNEDEIQRLRKDKTALESRVTEIEGDSNNKTTNGFAGGSGERFLQKKIRDNEEVIASQESQIVGLEGSLRSVQINLDRALIASKKAQEYKDERDEMVVERDELRRKANTVDKYKQKLEALTALERENVQTRRELEDLKRKLIAAEKKQQHYTGLEITIEEYTRTLSRVEQDANDLRNMKKQLDFDNAVLVQRLEILQDDQKEDKALITSLKARLQTFDGSRIPSTPKVTDGLDNELMNNDRALQDTDQLVRLQSENAELRSRAMELEDEIAPLQRSFDEALRKSTEMERKIVEATNEKSRLASSQGGTPAYKRRSSRLSSVSNVDDIVSTEAFREIKNQLAEEQRLKIKAEADLAAIRATTLSGTFEGTLFHELFHPETNHDSEHDHEDERGHVLDVRHAEELSTALEAVRAATRKQVESDEDKQTLDQHIASLADKVTASRMKLIRQNEVKPAPHMSKSSRSTSVLEESSRSSRISMAPSSLFSRESPKPTVTASHGPETFVLEGFSTDSRLAHRFPPFMTSGNGKRKA